MLLSVGGPEPKILDAQLATSPSSAFPGLTPPEPAYQHASDEFFIGIKPFAPVSYSNLHQQLLVLEDFGEETHSP